MLVAGFQFRQKNQSAENEAIYCYEGVKTEASASSQAESKFNCFGVSPSTGRFTRVFESSSVESSTVEIKKGYVLPGLWDGHGHLMQYGEFLHSADLFGSRSFDEIHGRLRGYLDSNPGSGTKDNWLV